MVRSSAPESDYSRPIRLIGLLRYAISSLLSYSLLSSAAMMGLALVYAFVFDGESARFHFILNNFRSVTLAIFATGGSGAIVMWADTQEHRNVHFYQTLDAIKAIGNKTIRDSQLVDLIQKQNRRFPFPFFPKDKE